MPISEALWVGTWSEMQRIQNSFFKGTNQEVKASTHLRLQMTDSFAQKNENVIFKGKALNNLCESFSF